MNNSPKRGLAAVMFTDMVGYTALMQENEELAILRRNRHREILEKTHLDFQGKIVQYFGDGTLSVFDSAVDAVRCGIEIQLALTKDPKVPLRIGIHTGDIVYSKEDIIGDGVNIASRLESFSVPGAILVSERVEDDVSNKPDIQTKQIGVFEFKNVTKPMKVFAISNEGLVVPAVEEITGKGKLAQAKIANKLPSRLTSFIGRDVEIAEIKSLLIQNRLVTLTGPGGTGKTSLSIRVAEDLSSYFKDGIFFIPLAPINEAKLVASAIAKVLEITETVNTPILELIKKYLQTKELLLVLDNFEQIVEASSDILALLQHCPELKIIVSSRIILRIQGEQEYPVQPLVLPDIRRLINIDSLSQFPSIRLFVERSKAVRHNFELNDENAFEIVEICNRLDGLPLAIELAAARMRLFSSKTLLEKLSKSLDILKSKDKSRPARHQTLQQTINWSFNLLSTEEQVLFQQLSVFTGAFTLDAVEEICQLEELNDLDIYEGIEALLEKSLIRQFEDANRDTKFLLFETLKEFASKKLLESGKTKKIRDRHSNYYLEFVEKAAPELTGINQAEWMNKIDAKYDNIRAAILWTIETQATEKGLRIGSAVWRYWLVKKQEEGFERLQLILSLPRKEHLEYFRAKSLSAMGALLNSSNNPIRGRKLLEESVAIFRKIDAKPELAVSLNHLGHTAYLFSKHQECSKLSNEALAIGQSLNLERVISTSYNNLGFNATFQSKQETAHNFYSKSAEIRNNIGDKRGYSFVLVNLAWTEIRMGKYEDATIKLDKAMDIVQEHNAGIHMVNWVWIVRIDNLIAQGRWSEAKSIIGKTKTILDRDIYMSLVIISLLFRVEVLLEEGEFNLIPSLLEAADVKTTTFGHHYYKSSILTLKLRSAIIQKQYDQASNFIKPAVEKTLEISNYLGLAEVLELIAQLKFNLKQHDQAAHALVTAKVLRKKRNLFLPLRFVDQLKKLTLALTDKIGIFSFKAIEEEVENSLENEIEKYK